METLAYTYTTQAEIEYQMSVVSLADYVGEVDATGAISTSNSASRITNAIEYATDVVNRYCYRYYTELVLSNSRFIRRLATFIAAYQITGLRGEAHRYEAEYNDAIEFLKAVHDGKEQVPRLAQRSDLAPAHSTIVIDDNFAKERARVERDNSVGEPYSGQKQDVTFNPNWL